MRIISFYLPQFHEIPENNRWWGEGFTEWTNVKKATPLFKGHAQPKVPLNSNYYDLSDVDVMKWQVSLAKKYGLYGFCFYHYWFNGKLLLEKPLENFLKSTIDFHFCISWANEHWTNQWVSDKSNVLIEQEYGTEEDWIKHFDYLEKFLLDERYIRIDGKPILIIYRPELIDCLNEMLDCWQHLAKERGIGELSFVYQHQAFYFMPNKDDSRFDYCIEYQPGFAQTSMSNNKFKFLRRVKRSLELFIEKRFKKDIRYKNKKLHFADYSEVWDYIVGLKPKNDKNIPGAFVNWDNTPRKGSRGLVYKGFSPEKFEFFMEKQILNARDNYNKNYMFMFAWNEWAEGGFLEPDEENGYASLESIKEALIACNELEDFSGGE